MLHMVCSIKDASITALNTIFLVFHDSYEICRHMLGQPDTIFRQIKNIPLSVHITRENPVYDRFSMSAANLYCCSSIFGKMHIESTLRLQSLYIDGIHKPFCRTMIQIFRRNCLFQLHINTYRVSLIGSDSGFILVKAVPLLMIRADDFLQKLPVNTVFLCSVDTVYQFLHICPAMFVKRYTDCFWFVAKYQTDKYTCFLVIHK